MLNGYYARRIGHAQFPSLDTPYSKYTNTNHAASGQDVHAISEILCERQAQLRDVAAELAFVESVMKRVHDIHQQFLDKHDQILASMRAHQGLVSCIRRLPPEILSEIFVRCLPSETYIRPGASTAPLLLVGVCSGWRKVALGTPRLWCSLSVRARPGGQKHGLSFFDQWLSRASGFPLSLAVDMYVPPLQNLVWRDEVTHLLQPYTSLTTRFHLTLSGATVPDLLLKDMPMLEHLTLRGDLDGVPKIAIVQPEPRLRSLSLDGVIFRAGVLSVFGLWTALTRLRVKLGSDDSPGRGIDGPVVLTLLALCPHLQDFAFSVVRISPRDVARYATRALTHSHLHSLDVAVKQRVGCLLNALTLPALRHLRIVQPLILPNAWEQNEFKAFVARSQCPLKTLGIPDQAWSRENHAEYKALIPTLKRIEYCDWMFSRLGGEIEVV